MSDNNNITPETPKQTPKEIQQNYYELLGDEDYFGYNVNYPDERILLQHYISFALFGPPQTCERGESIESDFEPSENDSKEVRDKKKHITDLFGVILRHGTNNEDPGLIAISTIFIVCELEKGNCPVPVFRIRKCVKSKKENCRIFIDDSGRVYNTWNNYKENNKLPKCRLIAPSNGKYSGIIINEELQKTEVILETFMSPANSLASEALDVADMVSTGASIGATLVMGTGLVAGMVSAVTIAPVVMGAAVATGAVTGAYSVARAGATLMDRSQHDQSIGLENSESRGCWFGIIGGAVAAVSGGATKLLTQSAESGTTVGQAAKVFYNITATSNMFINGVGVLNAGYQMYERYTNEDEITTLEVFQFASSVLFFTHAACNMKTANSVITETQNSVLKDYEKSLKSNRQRKMFRKAQLESRRLHGVQEGNAETIKGLQKINDPDKFFGSLVRGNKDFNKNKARFTISRDGQVVINGAYRIDPIEFQSLGKQGRQEIFNSIPAADTTIPQATFNRGQQYVLNQFLPGLGLENIDTNDSSQIDTIIVFILNRYDESLKRNIHDVVIKLLDRVKGHLFNQIKKAFPNHHPVIVLLEFLINYCQKNVYEMMELYNMDQREGFNDFFEKKFYISLRDVKSELDKAVQELQKWIDDQLKKQKISSFTVLKKHDASQGKASTHHNTILAPCSVCDGYFYKSL